MKSAAALAARFMVLGDVKVEVTRTEMSREAAADQTHCYTCGKSFGRVKYECQICGEWQCSEECRKRHINRMDNI
jgi:hypothetical protein